MTDPTIALAWFITPHGFGHAARASAIMAELNKLGSFRHHIFTRLPEWFFRESGITHFTIYPLRTDVGLVQQDALSEDLPGTLNDLISLYPLKKEMIDHLAEWITSLRISLVICDIAPLGIAVAERARIPCLLIENFTWDWIYASYEADYPDFSSYIELIRDLNQHATWHLQTEPVSSPQRLLQHYPPVSRQPRTPRSLIRSQLGIPPDGRMVLCTLGGIDTRFSLPEWTRQMKDVTFVIPGGFSATAREENRRYLPYHSGYYHPDLVQASDAVVGKLGYSTLAECFNCGVPYGFIPRPTFREYGSLAGYIKDHNAGLEIPLDVFLNQDWRLNLSNLLDLPRSMARRQSGALPIAQWIIAEALS